MEAPLDAAPANLVHLSDDVAVQRHFDTHNFRLLRAVAAAFAVGAVASALWELGRSHYLGLWLPVLNLVALRWVFWAAARAFATHRFSVLLLSYLVVQLGIVPIYFPELHTGLHVVGFLAPLVLLGFRLRVLGSLSIFTLFGTVSLGYEILQGWLGEATVSLPAIAIQVVVTLACLFFNLALMRSSYRRFMRDFQVASSRHRDRQRMRQELDYARQIQLRMLPRGDPKLDHLDVSGISLPATEVGGDYFEYFRPAEHRLSIAIGDVAGHGFASGLSLSGIRSCLYLLRDEPMSPRDIVSRLNRMVGETTARRMLITLLYADFDWQAGRVRLSSAGHPPMLQVRASTGEVVEVGSGAPPLGTRLEVRYREDTTTFDEGDVMLLYTDGLTEIMSPGGAIYGTDRLAAKLKENVHKSSREIREALLADLWNFKGDAEQTDDLTLVAIRALGTD